MDKKVEQYLLEVARNAIAVELGLNERQVEPLDKKILSEKRGVFVTLEAQGRLRGCIGNIMPVYPLEEAVKRNALSAAFDDPRFAPVEKSEFDDIKIEISVLTVPKEVNYKDTGDFLKKLSPMEHGVVLKKGFYSATYLPQVWEQIPDKEQFLSSLCMKAGLSMDEWRRGELEVSIYKVEKFEEEEA